MRALNYYGILPNSVISIIIFKKSSFFFSLLSTYCLPSLLTFFLPVCCVSKALAECEPMVNKKIAMLAFIVILIKSGFFCLIINLFNEKS